MGNWCRVYDDDNYHLVFVVIIQQQRSSSPPYRPLCMGRGHQQLLSSLTAVLTPPLRELYSLACKSIAKRKRC
jgi:hypothetical protein